MIHLKTFEDWNPLHLFQDKGDFHIVFTPTINQEQQSLNLKNISRSAAIKQLLSQFPKAKILKIQKLEPDVEESDVVDLEDED